MPDLTCWTFNGQVAYVKASTKFSRAISSEVSQADWSAVILLSSWYGSREYGHTLSSWLVRLAARKRLGADNSKFERAI